MSDQEQGPETAPKPKKPRKPKMVTVYNAHKYRSIHLGRGAKIPPQCTGVIPNAVYEKLKDYSWIKRAERGDVVK